MNETHAESFVARQTNTGLYVQLHDSGFTGEDIVGVQNAYRVACRLFNGRYRKTERAFICHAVGAASSVACFDSRLSYVVAALLHAAYDSGQFPDGRIGGATPRHRKWLTARVGAEVESILYRYSNFDFERGAPERYCSEGLDEADADLLLIALAHEVDDMADAGLRFAPKYGRSIVSRVEACARLADQIGKPELAATLTAQDRLYEDIDWVDKLKSTTLHGYHIVPNATAYFRHRFNHLRRKFVKVH